MTSKSKAEWAINYTFSLLPIDIDFSKESFFRAAQIVAVSRKDGRELPDQIVTNGCNGLALLFLGNESRIEVDSDGSYKALVFKDGKLVAYRTPRKG